MLGGSLLILCIGASLPGDVLANVLKPEARDPCARIAGRRWVSPAEARACLSSFPVDSEVKDNIIEVVKKTLPFHSSLNYQIQAPYPYDKDVRVDLAAEVERISEQDYSSDFAFSLDLYRTFNRANDGHCGVYNYCYYGSYYNFVPLPLVLLTASDGSQNVHIAPEAFNVATGLFGNELRFWQQALPGRLRGKLASLSGAKVLKINGKDPFVAVNKNAQEAGGYQAFATRQNSFFASYSRSSDGWNYNMGDFAMHMHPLVDRVKLTVQRTGRSSADTFTLPYRSLLSGNRRPFTDGASYRAGNCQPTANTNGVDKYDKSTNASVYGGRPVPLNVIPHAHPLTDIGLPQHLQPRLPALPGSDSIGQFYMLSDGVTGVLALGSFSPPNLPQFGVNLINGLQALQARGARRLVVDVTNNGGGVICLAHLLHRTIIGPRISTEPQAGFDTTLRAGPLARLIVQSIANGADPRNQLLYNPVQWTNATHHRLPPRSKWLKPHEITINGRDDSFSQRLGDECQAMYRAFNWNLPRRGLFLAQNVAIVSNGQCASSCSIFSITMAKEEGATTVVVGGKGDQIQEYCGTVGGQVMNFKTLNTEIKTTKLKNHRLAPPDFMANVVQTVTWRLGYGVMEPYHGGDSAVM